MKEAACRVNRVRKGQCLNVEAICSSETSVTFAGLHGGISQKAELVIVTAVRTTNLT
jgi:hypothetical protein